MLHKSSNDELLWLNFFVYDNDYLIFKTLTHEKNQFATPSNYAAI